jgi:hypothetical protein
MRYFLLILAFFSSLYSNDAQKIYQNSKDIEIKIFKNRTFKVTRKDGLILRDISDKEQFYIDRSSGQVKVDYQIIKRAGGIDIKYKITNPTNLPQAIPDFVVDGLLFNSSKSLNILNTRYFQYMHKRLFSEETFLNRDYFDVNGADYAYPKVYSPVIVVSDNSYSAGSSLIFNYQKDQIEPHMRVYKLKNRSWRYSYCEIDNRKLKPFEKLEVTLTLRFSNSKNWLYTLYPYKEHFDSLYGSDKNIIQKNLNPISGILLSYGSAAYENYLKCQEKEKNCDSASENILKYNLYGYNYYIRPDLYGLDPFVTAYAEKLKKSGYKRAMIWAVSGQYWRCPKSKIENVDGFLECSTNYPPQFISAESKNVRDTLKSLKKISDNNISLGLWWGRSGEVPQPFSWNPNKVAPFDIRDNLYKSFFEKELKEALSVGVDELGLDAFANMKIESQLPWLRYIRSRYPNIKLYHEGSVCDFLHTQTSAFLQPQNPNIRQIEDRAYLMEYLNPNGEIIVYYPHKTPDLKQLQRVIDWGYTPLILADPDIFGKPLKDIKSLKIK